LRNHEHSNVTDAPSPANGQSASNERTDEKLAAPKTDEKGSAAGPKQTFWGHLRALGDRWQTEDFCLYIYRLWPVTDTRNPERFLCKLAEPIDEDYLLKNYGTGKYLLMLNQRGKRVRTHVANPHNLQYPPAVHPNEVVASDPVNKLYFDVWAAPKDGHAPATVQAGKEATADTNTILNTVLAKTGAFDPKLAEMWEKTAKERDDLSRALAAKNAPPDLLELVKTVKDLFPSQPAPAEKSDALAIIAALKGLQPEPADPLEVLKQAREIFAPQANANESDDLARFERFLNIADKLAGWRGNAGPSSGWETALNFAKEVPGIVSPILQFVSNVMALRHGQPVPGSPVTPAAPTAWDPYRNQAQTAAYAATIRNQQPQPATPPTPQQPAASPTSAPPSPPASLPEQPPAQPDNQLLAIFQQYGNLVLNALNQGVSGDAFADNLASLFGTSTHAMIANNGEDALVSTMLSIAEFQLFGEGKIRRFVWEFIHFEELADEPEDHDKEEKIAAAARRG
jgi:hypothetical protein